MIQTKKDFYNKLLHTYIACRIFRLQCCSIYEKTFTLNLGLCKNLKWVLKSHSCPPPPTHTHASKHTYIYTPNHTKTHTHRFLCNAYYAFTLSLGATTPHPQ